MNSNSESYLDSLLSAMMGGSGKRKNKGKQEKPAQSAGNDAQASISMSAPVLEGDEEAYDDPRDLTEIIDSDFGDSDPSLAELSDLLKKNDKQIAADISVDKDISDYESVAASENAPTVNDLNRMSYEEPEPELDLMPEPEPMPESEPELEPVPVPDPMAILEQLAEPEPEP